MKSNGRAILTLMLLVIIALLILFLERKFLVVELRGETVSKYEQLAWHDKIIFLVDDFEGLNHADSVTLLKANFFSFGSTRISIDNKRVDTHPMAATSDFKVEWRSDAANDLFGGWGKGVGANFDLDVNKDYFNFRTFISKTNPNDTIKILIQEDDNDDGIFQEDKDDVWEYKLPVVGNNQWQFISIPLNKFTDSNTGGDGEFNVTRKRGIHNIIFSFSDKVKHTPGQSWYFDFLCFSSQKITPN